MKIVQKYPLDWFGTVTFEIGDSKIIHSYKNLYSEIYKEYDISGISPSVTHYKYGNSSWTNIGLFLVFLMFVLSFLNFLGLILFYILLLATVVSFLLILKKDKFVGFQDKNNQYLFAVRLSKTPNKEEEFINQLKNEIRKGIQG